MRFDARNFQMTNQRTGPLKFDTDDFQTHERLSAFCDGFFPRIVALDINKKGDRPFKARAALRMAGSVGIGEIVTSPADYARTPRTMRDGADAFVISLCRRGEGFSTFGDRSVSAYQAVVCDNARPQILTSVTDTAWWTVKLARARLSSLVPHADSLAGFVLDKHNVALRLLFGYLQGTAAIDMADGGLAADAFGNHIADLVALALGTRGDSRKIAERRGLRAARRSVILDKIDSGFADAGFSAASVAAALGISARYVHMVIEETGHTFSDLVLHRRLEKALALLLDPQRDGDRIADIAHEAGFTDLSHFNRSFRRHFGETPSGIRSRSSL